MKSIERISILDKNKLNKEFYFQSMLEEAYSKGLLNEVDIEKLQIMCLELLVYKTERYTSGDSSSVPVEVAETIMKSNLYTIGLYLKSFPCADDAVKALKETSISELYSLGRKLMETKIKTARHYHLVVMENMIEIDNYAYTSTFVDGIKGFFKIYNADYEAHEIHITADYPLINPIENLVGIEFIEKYLESINYENTFCKCFSEDEIHHLLCGYDEHYEDLIFNLFEQILTSAIGCVLAGTEAVNLNITTIQIERLYCVLSEKSRDEIEVEIVNAYHKLIKELALTNLSLKKYIEKALSTIIANVFNAAKAHRLETVFIKPKYPETNPHIYFSFGEKIDNEKYRDIIDEVMRCRFTSDKIAIIKNKITSLADLEDLLFDAELTASEITAVLKGLEIAEIAALAKRHPYKFDIAAIDLSESEQAFRLCLHNYILSLSQEKQCWIEKAISLFGYDNEQ